jgi:hypothetical protein
MSCDEEKYYSELQEPLAVTSRTVDWQSMTVAPRRRSLVSRYRREPRLSCIAFMISMVLLGAIVGACAASTAPVDTPSPPLKVLAGSCPTERESPAGKVWDEKYVRDRADTIFRVALSLKDDGLPNIPSCPGGSGRDERCPQRDDALIERENLNLQQVKCVRDVLGGFGMEGGLSFWYELPYHFSSGKPVPIVLTFSADVSMRQLNAIAAHPYVARIEAMPGDAAFLGARAPAPPKECPTNTEPATPKLTEAVHGSGRQPFIIDLKDRGVLPASPTNEELQAAPMDASCPGDPPCDAALQTVWERVILNRREVTCVKRAMDIIIKGKPLYVSYGAAQIYDNLSRTLGPFSDSLSITSGFGIGITWEDAVKLAGHPYVERISMNGNAIQTQPFPQVQPEGCPPDLTKPIPMFECTDARESPDGKYRAKDQQRWESTIGPTDVAILLREVNPSCPLPASCPTDPEPCPAKDAVIARRQAENEASQKCVRQLIESLGGTIDPGDTISLINILFAQLTWEQIQAVAALPSVILIESNDGVMVGSPGSL